MVDEDNTSGSKSIPLHQLVDDLKQAQNGLLIEDQLRNDERVTFELANHSPPRSRLERIGWIVIAVCNSGAALILTSMAWEDHSLLLMVIGGGAWLLCYKMFRKAFRS